jgi:hypothetical protein
VLRLPRRGSRSTAAWAAFWRAIAIISAAGATTCVLVSTAMGLPLYQKFGFTDVMPMVEFRSHDATEV